MNGGVIFGLSSNPQRAKMLCCNNYTLTPVCRWWLEEFAGLTDYYINVNCCVLFDKGGCFEPPEQIRISQHRRDGYETLVTLFHELRHYYQYKTRMWPHFDPKPFVRPPKPEWSPSEAALERYMDYMNYPWELDARENSMEALRQFLKTDLSKPYKPNPNPPPKRDNTPFIFEPVQADPSYPSFAS